MPGERIQASHGRVEGPTDGAAGETVVHISGRWCGGDSGLRDLAYLPHVRTVFFSAIGLTEYEDDPQLAAIEALRPQTRESFDWRTEGNVFDREPPVTDAGINYLAGLKETETLDLATTLTTDRGLREIGRLGSLRRLVRGNRHLQ